MSTESRIAALEAENAKLKQQIAAGAVPRAVLGDTKNGLFLYIAGIGYVLTSIDKSKEILLNSVGLIESAYGHKVHCIASCVYEPNKMIITTNVASGAMHMYSFTDIPLTLPIRKYLSEISTMHKRDTKFSEAYRYNASAEMIKSIRIVDGVIEKTKYIDGKVVRVTKIRNGVKTVIIDGVAVTKETLCDRVRRIAGPTTCYILATDAGDITYVLNTDNVTRGGVTITGSLSINGSLFTFYHHGIAETFRMVDGKMVLLSSCSA